MMCPSFDTNMVIVHNQTFPIQLYFRLLYFYTILICIWDYKNACTWHTYTDYYVLFCLYLHTCTITRIIISGRKLNILSLAKLCQVIFNVDQPSANDDLATHSQTSHVRRGKNKYFIIVSSHFQCSPATNECTW